MNAPTPQASAPSGPMNMDQAVQALAAILPEEGQQDGGETQESPKQEEVTAASEEEALDAQDESSEESSDEQTELEEDTQDETKPEVFTVKVDGKEIEVTLDELQKGYSRTQDYTRKTQQVAEAGGHLGEALDCLASNTSRTSSAIRTVCPLPWSGCPRHCF